MRGGQYGPYGDKCGAPEAGGRRKRTNRRGNRRTMRGGQVITSFNNPEYDGGRRRRNMRRGGRSCEYCIV
jgi:hypothetical protein